MPLKLDIKRQLVQRTDRVKGVDLHPTEPWLLANLYNGNVYIWNYLDQTMVKSFEITELPVRAAKFIARKQWVLTGSDDMCIRVFNYNTMDKVKTFEAHTDYLRCIAVHPNLPYILTSSDDMLIKLWDWDKGWSCVQVFEGHSHYVMQVAFNPKDTNTFASASLDRTIKVWSLGQPTPNFTLEGHEKGVNAVDYFTGGDRPYLISGADDKLVKVWDYQTKACVQTLEGHAHNISSVMFHPELPVIVTGSEDGTVKIWHSTTYRLENTLDYRMERVWSLGYSKGSNSIAIGYDEGAVVIKVGREEPVASMDTSGKIIWARHNEIQTVNLKALGGEFEFVDGERLPLAVKDLGSCDLYPQALLHNPNGRFVVVSGDGEYIVYTALAWRNKSFGSGLEFVWSVDSNDYAIRESPSRVKIYKNFQDKMTLKLDFPAEGIHGGALVAVRAAEYVVFYDWEGRVVRRIDVAARSVHWSDSGELCAIVGDQSFYILKFDRDAVDAYFASGAAASSSSDDEGVEDAFDLQAEISERVRTCVWVGDCFVYNNASWRLNYCVGGEVTTVVHLDRPMYLLGYLASHNRVFLIDKEFGVVSYTLLLSMVELKTRIMRDDIEGALALLPSVPADQHNSVARFLEAKGMLQEALNIATDPEYRFDLAIQLGDLPTAQGIATQLDSEPKWKQLGELALASGQLAVAEACMTRARDFSGLLMLLSARGDRPGLAALAESASLGGKHNVTFLALFLLGQLEQCVQLLLDSGRLPEAAFFARTYVPSAMSRCVALWKTDLATINPKAADSLADPAEYPNLFPDLDLALQAEKFAAASRGAVLPAKAYAQYEGATMVNLIEQMRDMGVDSSEEPSASASMGVKHTPVAADAHTDEEVGMSPAVAAVNAAVGAVSAGISSLAMQHNSSEEQEEQEEDEGWGAPPPPAPAPVASSPQQAPRAAPPPPAQAPMEEEEVEEEEEEEEVEEEEEEEEEEEAPSPPPKPAPFFTTPPAPKPPSQPAPAAAAAAAVAAADDDDPDKFFAGEDGEDEEEEFGDPADNSAAVDIDDDWGIDGTEEEEEGGKKD